MSVAHPPPDGGVAAPHWSTCPSPTGSGIWFRFLPACAHIYRARWREGEWRGGGVGHRTQHPSRLSFPLLDARTNNTAVAAPAPLLISHARPVPSPPAPPLPPTSFCIRTFFHALHTVAVWLVWATLIPNYPHYFFLFYFGVAHCNPRLSHILTYPVRLPHMVSCKAT